MVHQVLERLTVAKVRVGLLRLRMQRQPLAPAEIEEHLELIEQEIDATAALATNMHAENTGTA
jgi:hypothetical protein